MGNESECGAIISGEPDNRVIVKWVSGDLFVLHSDSFLMSQEKNYSFLIFTMFPKEPLSKVLRERL